MYLLLFLPKFQKKEGGEKRKPRGEKYKHCYFAERLMAWEELNSCTHHTSRNLMGLQNTEALTSCSSVQEEHCSWEQGMEGWPISQDLQSCQLWVNLTNSQMFMFKFIRLNYTCTIIWQYHTQREAVTTEIPTKIFYKMCPFSSWYWEFGAIITFCNKLMKLRGESSTKATTTLPAKAWSWQSAWPSPRAFQEAV